MFYNIIQLHTSPNKRLALPILHCAIKKKIDLYGKNVYQFKV